MSAPVPHEFKITNDIENDLVKMTQLYNELVALYNEFISLSDEVGSHLTNLVSDVDGVHGLKIERGTWTPVLTSTGGGSPIYNANTNGSYLKIGNLVHVQFYLGLLEKGTMQEGVLRVNGLPFMIDGVIAADKSYTSIGRVQNINLPADAIGIISESPRSTTRIDLLKMTRNGSSGLALSEVGGTLILTGSMLYKSV